jgi:hypothetical protein
MRTARLALASRHLCKIFGNAEVYYITYIRFIPLSGFEPESLGPFNMLLLAETSTSCISEAESTCPSYATGVCIQCIQSIQKFPYSIYFLHNALDGI